MGKAGASHLSYLLRLWPEASSGAGNWRASLENPHTGERHGFAQLSDLFTFLEARAYGPRVESSHGEEKGEAK